MIPWPTEWQVCRETRSEPLEPATLETLEVIKGRHASTVSVEWQEGTGSRQVRVVCPATVAEPGDVLVDPAGLLWRVTAVRPVTGPGVSHVVVEAAAWE